jgi:2-C-methyl-D-erythritol 2,4-cyclodiphosphate synthase
MQKVIATILSIDENAVSVKATTSEKMGFVGREEGIAAYATVLLL